MSIARLAQVAVRGDVLIERHLVGLVPPPPPALAVARLVDGDPVDPGLERRLAAEIVDGAEDAEEDFLGEVEGLVAVAQQVQGELVNHPLVTGHELGAGRGVTRRAALDERRLAVSDLNPSECPGVFHDGFRDGSNAHGQCINIRTRPLLKVPGHRFLPKAWSAESADV